MWKNLLRLFEGVEIHGEQTDDDYATNDEINWNLKDVTWEELKCVLIIIEIFSIYLVKCIV